MQKENIYMAIAKPPFAGWDKCEQIFLGHMYWKDAVAMAKSQKYATRLSNSSGFNNQGHYFQPEPIFSEN